MRENSAEASGKELSDRTRCQLINPFLVLVLILLCAYSFFILEVSRHIWVFEERDKSYDYSGKPNAVDYINWTFFLLFFVLSIWSLFQIVFTGPGYVPECYKYDNNELTNHDRFIYQYLKQALHSTTRQQLEALDPVNILKGSIRQTLGAYNSEARTTVKQVENYNTPYLEK